MPSNYKPLQVRLRPDQLAGRRALAARRGVSVTHLVRESVDLLLANIPADEDPLLDIIGLVEGGLPDLSERHDDYLTEAYADHHNLCAPGSS